MKKIAFILFFILTQTGFAQVEFTAKLSRTEIALNENVRVDFTINREGFDFVAPDFENFFIIGGPHQQINNTIIEGKSKVSKSMGYIIRPKKQGTLTIGSASIDVIGKIYTTAPIELIVTDKVDKPLPLDMGVELYFIAEPNRTEVYEKELFEVQYSLLYTDQTEVGVGNFIRRNYLSANSESFAYYVYPSREVKIEKEIYNGKPFFKIDLGKAYYSSKKSGDLTLYPLEFDVDLEFPTDERDTFGRRKYDKVIWSRETNIVNIKVKPLPEARKSESFNGLVGRYNFSQKVNKIHLKLGETFDIEMIVEGTGNQLVFPMPKPNLSEGLEIIEEKEEKPVFYNDKPEFLLRKTYTIKPKHTGKHTIGEIMYAYFDPVKEKYIYDMKNEQTITVIE